VISDPKNLESTPNTAIIGGKCQNPDFDQILTNVKIQNDQNWPKLKSNPAIVISDPKNLESTPHTAIFGQKITTLTFLVKFGVFLDLNCLIVTPHEFLGTTDGYQ
jgi:hypothetical protein